GGGVGAGAAVLGGGGGLWGAGGAGWRGGGERAPAAGAPPAVKRVAHTLKGAVAIFGARRSTAAALRLEGMGRAGELKEAPGALAELRQSLGALLEALEAYRPPEG